MCFLPPLSSGQAEEDEEEIKKEKIEKMRKVINKR